MHFTSGTLHHIFGCLAVLLFSLHLVSGWQIVLVAAGIIAVIFSSRNLLLGNTDIIHSGSGRLKSRTSITGPAPGTGGSLGESKPSSPASVWLLRGGNGRGSVERLVKVGGGVDLGFLSSPTKRFNFCILPHGVHMVHISYILYYKIMQSI